MTNSRSKRLGEYLSKKDKPQVPNVTKHRSIITYREDGVGPVFIPTLENRDTLHIKSCAVRSSTRWIDAYNTPNGGLNVPFIDDLGRFSGFTVCKWSCDPRSMIATVTSTISKRIVAYARRHNPWHIVKKRLRDLLAASAYYAFSKNGYFWDRVLFFSRNLERYKTPLRSLRIFFSSKWDDDKRFVYSHVIFQTKWLLFRASLPRDKSQFYSDSGGHFWSSQTISGPSKINVTNCIRDICYKMILV
jgi:hypothetical protein